jgi:hypothetical protein
VFSAARYDDNVGGGGENRIIIGFEEKASAAAKRYIVRHEKRGRRLQRQNPVSDSGRLERRADYAQEG